MDQPGAEHVYRGDIERLMAKVADQRGLDLTQYRTAYVERRIAARLRALNLHTYRQYSRLLDSSPEEFAKLLDAMTINVTDFFRDPPVYQLFRSKIVPEIIARKKRTRHRMIRVWSAGCATGEEPYSIAMSFLSELGAHADGFMLNVIATDLDPNALAYGQKAEYDVAKLKHISKPDQMAFVDIHGDKFRIKPAVKSHVKFKALNLFTDEPIHVVDVLFCRNVFIYFTREQQARVLDIFADSIARDGYMVLGRSEKLAASVAGSFELVSGRDRIYRKK
ncbi:MAG: protein-glutamate O-methyltransferase CheR [Coriobacteriia bacterium]|nr:protein-glutamate O-methyltransferase CheR [Coriobacteriia bacterium]